MSIAEEYDFERDVRYCPHCGQKWGYGQHERQLPIPDGGSSGSWTGDAILLALQKKQPQTREMLIEEVGMTTVGQRLALLAIDGRVVWQKPVGHLRWYAMNEDAFTPEWMRLAYEEDPRIQNREDRDAWQKGRRLLRAVRRTLRDLSQ